jgi:uncharacterized protein YacL
MNRSKKSPQNKVSKIEFGTLGIVIGLVVGVIAGLAIGMATKPSLILTQLVTMAGVIVGAFVEAIRFWWRKRRRKGV